MQTFLPYADFELSAQLLDKQRCWKQVVEAHQLLNVLLGRNDKKGWTNHPATRMWYSYESALQAYYNTFFDFCIYIHNVKPNKLLVAVDLSRNVTAKLASCDIFRRTDRKLLVE